MEAFWLQSLLSYLLLVWMTMDTVVTFQNEWTSLGPTYSHHFYSTSVGWYFPGHSLQYSDLTKETWILSWTSQELLGCLSAIIPGWGLLTWTTLPGLTTSEITLFMRWFQMCRKPDISFSPPKHESELLHFKYIWLFPQYYFLNGFNSFIYLLFIYLRATSNGGQSFLLSLRPKINSWWCLGWPCVVLEIELGLTTSKANICTISLPLGSFGFCFVLRPHPEVLGVYIWVHT